MSEKKDKNREKSKDKKDKDKEKEKEKDKKSAKKSGTKDKLSEPPSPKIDIRRGTVDLEPNSALIPPPTQTVSKLCIHHSQPMAFYCDSCQEPVCNTCTVIGPHNTQLHRLISIQAAFRTQSTALKHIMLSTLVPKRDQLAAQIYRLDFRVGEIKQVKTYIERDIRTEFEGMLETLRFMEGTKDVVLRHEVESLRRDIEKINEIIDLFYTYTKEGGDQFEFLTKYAYLKESIQYIMHKDFKRTIDVVANDFPNELPKRRAALEKANMFEQLSSFKDKIIQELSVKSSERIDKLREDFEISSAQEMHEWSKLTDHFTSQLKKYKTLCYYCGASLSSTTVNTICHANNKSYYPLDFGFTEEAPESGYHKTERHFFAAPRPELLRKSGMSTPRTSTRGRDQQEEEAIRNSPLKNESARVPYQTFLDVTFSKILKSCAEKDYSIENLIQSYDPKNTGYISFFTLSYLLNEYCALDPIEIDKLKEVFDPLNKNSVLYQDFLDMLNDFENQE